MENVWPSEVVSVEAAVLPGPTAPGPVTSVFLVVSMTPLVAAVASVAARALVTDPAIIMPAISSANAVSLPIIGMGGIATAEDALEFIMAGATAVSVGTANFYNPYATVEIAEGIENFMKKQKVEDIRELIGCVK